MIQVGLEVGGPQVDGGAHLCGQSLVGLPKEGRPHGTAEVGNLFDRRQQILGCRWNCGQDLEGERDASIQSPHRGEVQTGECAARSWKSCPFGGMVRRQV